MFAIATNWLFHLILVAILSFAYIEAPFADDGCREKSADYRNHREFSVFDLGTGSYLWWFSGELVSPTS